MNISLHNEFFVTRFKKSEKLQSFVDKKLNWNFGFFSILRFFFNFEKFGFFIIYIVFLDTIWGFRIFGGLVNSHVTPEGIK